jgi:hypothetical protein
MLRLSALGRMITMKMTTRSASAAFLALVLCSVALTALACTVPVFRYALERWPSDRYEIMLVHNGPLDEELSGLIDTLETQARDYAFDANIWLTKIDVATEDGAAQAREALGEIPAELPLIAVTAPATPSGGEAGGQVVWRAPFTAESLRRVLESPIRREIGKRILEGDSAVWILLESGDAKADEAAAEMLEGMLDEAEQQLVLPEIAPQDEKYLTTGEGAPDLKIQFSTIRLARDNAEEAFLVETLLRSEGDLKDFDTPIAFPIYGRGRALYALVGAGINENNIAEACMFLTGACSCEVKDLNPGTDLLMAVDWEGLMGGRLALNEALPELTGFAGFGAVPDPEVVAALEEVTPPAETLLEEATVQAMDPARARGIEPEEEGVSYTGGLMVAVGAFALVAFLSLFIWMKKG